MNSQTNGGPAAARCFPEGFLWGTGASAYQIEGAVHADGRGTSIWDVFTHAPGNISGGDTGDVACDAYNRVDEDLRVIAELGVNAYRFSVSWPRVQPTGSGAVNQKGLDYYRKLAARLRDLDVMPIATAYHWDLPQALEDQGGWGNRETAERLAEYVEIIADALADTVGMWVTINEPLQTVHQGYRVGTHAPGKRDLELAAAANHHVMLGHGYALPVLRSRVPDGTPIGVALDPQPYIALDRASEHPVAVLDAEINGVYLDPLLRGSYPADAREYMRPPAELIRDGDMELISAPIDFLGVNYYRPHYIRTGDERNLRQGESALNDMPGFVEYRAPELDVTIMDWPVVPEALTELLVRVHEESGGLPVYITENGCAADDSVTPEGTIEDYDRIAYIHKHLGAALDAVERGVNVAGYIHWSLMDNFEWAFGYAPRFGLYHVDFATQKRTPKRSAEFFGGVARAGELAPLNGRMPVA
jgi:beta-glucosidase